MKEKNTQKNAKNRLATAITALGIGMLLGTLSPVLAMASKTMGPDGAAQPVCQVIAYYGEPAQAHLLRYYQEEAVPDNKNIPVHYTDPDGTAYKLSEINGPIQTEFGSCWEAAYRKVE